MDTERTEKPRAREQIEADLAVRRPESCDCYWKEPHSDFDCTYPEDVEVFNRARDRLASDVPALVAELDDTRAERDRILGASECNHLAKVEWFHRAEAAEAALAQRDATIARVKALTRKWSGGGGPGDYWTSRLIAALGGEPETAACICTPCTTPGNGGPTPGHCAACCGQTGIEEYDSSCPVAGHRELAFRQFGPEPETAEPASDGQQR